MKVTKSVCVYCGASRLLASDSAYIQSAQDLATILSAEKMRLVYGGGKLGLMGVVANTMLDHDGEVLGIITDHLYNIEQGNDRLTDLRVVTSMHERKTVMFEESDAFVILPGGFGTLDEVCEIITWKQIGLHNKPIIFVDVDGYWSPLFNLFAQHMINEKFITQAHKEFYHIVSTPQEALELLSELL